MTHPAAELLRAIADGKQMEIHVRGKWEQARPDEALTTIAACLSQCVRIARPMVTRQVSYPEPLRVKPKRGEKYWYVSSEYEKPLTLYWENCPLDHHLLAAGMAFATEADAAEAHRALFGAQT